MPDPRPPSPFTLWLEEALTGWILPVAGLVALGIAAGLYLLGYLPEGATAAVVAVLAGLLAAVHVVKPALAPRADGVARILAGIAAAGALVLAVVPPVESVTPGTPLIEGSLPERGATIALPASTPSHVRLLVHVPLPQTGTPEVRFRITGTEPPAEGKLERTYSSARVGRSGRTQVAHDRSSTYVATRLAGGAPALVLDRLSGERAGDLQVAVFPDRIPPALHWTLAIAVVLLAAAAEARLRKGSSAAVAGMAVAFGLLVADNATPTSAIGTTLGSVLLGGIAGAAAGGLAAFLAKRVVPAAPPPPRAAAAAAAQRSR
ncbi:hypothetical protein [Anaeromyxobacter oryzae]|uniref:Uncharacterized protein n=1 Tax=Anaeromyxobacter oryzae TaxID=2918170 RepID=A0ABN6MXT8_9BACT|nr:hypothetical protein [Anaeromyxobacter oryzae]BDG05779.1 hypothetical protein AMOR_47750 [Anaeromyxobacter oryzae]